MESQLDTKPHDIALWLKQLGQPAADRDYKPGHQRMSELLISFKLQTPRIRIRIAGTNGKGSTAIMLSNALQACGLKVGLYTSPHIHNFNERICINGMPVSDTALFSLMKKMMPIALKVGASYFEVATALALKHFSDSKVDIEILEAGVGAKLDATTAVGADLALITPIGMDHQAWLGNTLTDIAKEKAHITNDCQICISAEQNKEVLNVLTKHYPALNIANNTKFHLQAIGTHQQQNASLAWAAVQQLAANKMIHDDMLDHAKDAIQNTLVPGRLQQESFGNATIWLDAAHNAHAIHALLPALSNLANPLDAILVFTREDRDLSDSIDLLKPFTKRMIGDDKNYFDTNYTTITMALENELKQQPGGTYLILGSFITVAKTQSWLKTNFPRSNH